jgi:hypothetical protein
LVMPISFERHRFSPDLIRQAVWALFHFTLSIRDVEELLAQRGIFVCRETIRCWAIKSGPLIAANLRRRRSPPTGRWHLDEMVVKFGGGRMYLWRAIDAGVATAATIGLILGVMWLLTERNLWAGIAIHGLFDFAAMTAIYFGAMPQHEGALTAIVLRPFILVSAGAIPTFMKSYSLPLDVSNILPERGVGAIWTWAQSSLRFTWPPSSAVLEASIAEITFS